MSREVWVIEQDREPSVKQAIWFSTREEAEEFAANWSFYSDKEFRAVRYAPIGEEWP